MSRQLQLCLHGGKWALKRKEPVQVRDVVSDDESEYETDEQKIDKKLELFHLLTEKYSEEISNKRRRSSYSEQEQRVVDSVLKDAGGNCHLVADVCRAIGFYTMDRRTVRRIKAGATGGRGKPVNPEFEQAVLSRVLFQSLSTVTQVTDITGNILHSLSMLQLAAEQVKTEVPKFRQCPIVNRLKFSLCWAAGVCRRNRLSKRLIITSSTAELPDPQIIRQAQRRIACAIVDGGYTAGDILPGDETGINWKATETNLYCPVGSERPAGNGDDKLRITCVCVYIYMYIYMYI